VKQYWYKYAKKKETQPDVDVKTRIDTLLKHLDMIYGTQGFILRASKLNAVELVGSDKITDRIIALERLLREDPTINRIPEGKEWSQILNELEELVVEKSARRAVEDRIQQRVQDKMEENYNNYILDIQRQILKEESNHFENAQTLKKLGQLEKMERKGLNRSAFDLLRPGNMEEVIGQEKAIKALVAKLNTPYPSIFYSMARPGWGKPPAPVWPWNG
jgi:ATP-dependent Lon protease